VGAKEPSKNRNTTLRKITLKTILYVKLLIQEINVAEYLLKYRQRNVKLATLNNNLSDLKQLYICHILSRGAKLTLSFL
jgi:hypothetical protein